MKKEKQVKSYQRRTKSGKVVTVKAHTAKYDAAEKAKEAAKKKGAGKELEDKFGKKKMPDPNLSMNEYLDELKKGNSKKESEVKEAAKKESKNKTPKVKKDTTNKSNISGQAFTAAEFKEWYHGTGSAADKKVAKALRAQLGRSGYRKFEDEAINNYSSRGHLSMFKKVGSVGGETTSSTTKSKVTKKPEYQNSDKSVIAFMQSNYRTHYNPKTGNFESSPVGMRTKIGITSMETARERLLNIQKRLVKLRDKKNLRPDERRELLKAKEKGYMPNLGEETVPKKS